MANDKWSGARVLNGAHVTIISEELSDREVWEIQTLEDNISRMFQGTILSGEGFKISAETAQSLLASDQGYRNVVFPFIGGNEINKDHESAPTCWVICFWDWPEEKARRFEEAFAIIQTAVYPERQLRKPNGDYKYRAPQPQRWWQYGEKRPALYHAIGRGRVFENHPETWNPDDRQRARVLAISTGTTKYPVFTLLPPDMMYSNKLCILADDRYSVFAVLSSDIHSVWAWAQKTTLQADMESMRYAHGNIFETFPFPSALFQNGDQDLERLGTRFFEGRQSFMQNHKFGLTKFYNAFHDPDNNVEALNDLRKLQGDINKTVLQRYDWRDVDPATGFHGVGYLPDGKNVRFTVSEEARLEVLRRLSKLNKARFDQQPQSSSTTKYAQTRDVSIEDGTLEDGLFAIGGGRA
jgi:hypothetical protein